MLKNLYNDEIVAIFCIYTVQAKRADLLHVKKLFLCLSRQCCIYKCSFFSRICVLNVEGSNLRQSKLHRIKKSINNENDNYYCIM